MQFTLAKAAAFADHSAIRRFESIFDYHILTGVSLMKKTVLTLAIAAFCTVSAQSSLASDIDASKIYSKKCKMCHKFDRKKIGPAFKDMNKDAASLKNTLINGRKMMPKFGKKLSGEEIDAMIAFIQSKQG
ncbi:MAG: cytochrome c [Mariprofundales bacterium]